MGQASLCQMIQPDITVDGAYPYELQKTINEESKGLVICTDMHNKDTSSPADMPPHSPVVTNEEHADSPADTTTDTPLQAIEEETKEILIKNPELV